MNTDTDTIGGFPIVKPTCNGCGTELLEENAWMADGCPCNTPLGVNSMNETRWRLLMDLQQRQSREVKRLRAVDASQTDRLMTINRILDDRSYQSRMNQLEAIRDAAECRKWESCICQDYDRLGEECSKLKAEVALLRAEHEAVAAMFDDLLNTRFTDVSKLQRIIKAHRAVEDERKE